MTYSRVIYVRATPALHQAVAERARREGFAASAWAAAALIEHLGLPHVRAPAPGRVRAGGTSPVIFIRTDPTVHRAVVEEALRRDTTVSELVCRVLAQALEARDAQERAPMGEAQRR